MSKGQEAIINSVTVHEHSGNPPILTVEPNKSDIIPSRNIVLTGLLIEGYDKPMNSASTFDDDNHHNVADKSAINNNTMEASVLQSTEIKTKKARNCKILNESLASLVIRGENESTNGYFSPTKKSVSFSCLSIREYGLIVGDNPSCSEGTPTALGWDHTDDIVFNIDEYEHNRQPRRTLPQMKMGSHLRRELLYANGLTCSKDIRRIERQMYKQRRKRNHSKFFAHPDEKEEDRIGVNREQSTAT